jgi:hypothetical protein
MARKFLTAIDLSKNELQNARVQNLGAAPGSPVAGQIYYDTSTTPGKLYYWNGSAWVDTSGGISFASPAITLGTVNSAGVATSTIRSDATILAFDATAPTTSAVGDAASVGAAAVTARRDHVHGREAFGAVAGTGAFGQANADGAATTLARSSHVHSLPAHGLTQHQELIATSDLTDWPRVAALDLNSQKITSMADGTATTDGATFGQLNAILQGRKWKEPVRAIATGNLTLSGTQTVDGVALVAGDRVLASAQTTTSASGIYVVAAGAWARATDADTGVEVTQATVFSQGGTTGIGDEYTQTSTVVTIGTDAQTWTKTGEGNTAYSADGTTIELVGTSFRIAATAAGNGLSGGGGSALAVSVDAANMEISGDAVRISASAAGAGLTGGGASALAVGAGTGITVNADDVAINTAVVVRKYATSFGDAAALFYVITHNLNTLDVTVSVYDNTGPNAELMVDVEHTSVNTITVRTAVAPTLNQYRCVVHG